MKTKARRPDQEEKDVLDQLGDFITDFVKSKKIFDGGKDKARKDDDEDLSYIKAMLDDKSVAALMPSSKFMVKRIIKAMDLRGAKTVIEYGAAAGVITREILPRLPADGRLLAVEFNRPLFDMLSRIADPRLILAHGDVREIDAIAAKHGIEQADVVVSGVPFSMFSGRQRHELLLKTHALVRPGGRFVAYQVTTHLITMLDDYFKRFETEFEIRNLPPHFIFTAYK